MALTTLFLSLICFISSMTSVSLTFGPPYPVTASWFQDRFTSSDWVSALTQFSKQGGDSVMLRAPPIVLTTAAELAVDADFKWCGKACHDEALHDLSALGLKVAMFGKYEYEEAFEESSIIQCPQYEKKIVSSRIYYRLVLPLEPGHLNEPCSLNGTNVMVLLTSFAGIDPHELLIERARDLNMSVYFGLPQPPLTYENGNRVCCLDSYFEFVRRIMLDHKVRYSNIHENTTDKDLYSVLKGYVNSNDFRLTDVNELDLNILETFKQLGTFTHANKKLLVISTHFQSNRYEHNSSISEYVTAFERLVTTASADVISIKDGRGSGNGGFFWQTQLNTTIASIDNVLYRILKDKHPFISDKVTFNDVFWTSVHEMFHNLAVSRDKVSKLGNKIDLWLNIEAYEYLHDDPCLPVDRSGSGMDQMLNRIAKSRLDWALTHGSAFVQKVAAFAWDSCFTCKTNNHTTNLTNQIQADTDRPIIAYCAFHSEANMSVVVIGYNFLSPQGFKVTWPNVNGKRIVSYVDGYYFEVDWGIEHDRVPSLMYTQLYDPYDLPDLAPKGYITVLRVDSYHACTFRYDYSDKTEHPTPTDKPKKYYYIERTPTYRVYGQDSPRPDNIDTG